MHYFHHPENEDEEMKARERPSRPIEQICCFLKKEEKASWCPLVVCTRVIFGICFQALSVSLKSLAGILNFYTWILDLKLLT